MAVVSRTQMDLQYTINRAQEMLPQVARKYSRLLLVVGRSGCGKTAALGELASRLNLPVCRLGSVLSRSLLDLTDRQRILQLPRLVEESISLGADDTSIVDNTEVLFNPALAHDPLRLLLGLARRRTLVASWLGEFADGQLVYASPDHAEFRRYPIDDLAILTMGKGGAE